MTTGFFCELYGASIHNRVLEYLLENSSLDIAVGDMAKELGISKPKAYQVINEFLAKGTVHKTRLVGKTQLYGLNKDNSHTQLYIKHFRQCLQLIQTDKTHRKNSSVTDTTTKTSVLP